MIALKKQLLYQIQLQNKPIETVFIGGGTPSTIEAFEYKEIFKIISPYIVENCEITIEANPNSANYDWLKEIFEIGITRISFGVQSFNDEKLQFLGRNHNKIQAIQAINDAKKVGFEHINCDIIYDTKLDSKQLLQSDLSIVQSLPIDHISAYSLTIEEGTKFFNKSNVQVEDIDLAHYLFDKLQNLGFIQYEISNFALSNEARSKHNLGYWQYKEYLGVGSGAVGCLNNQRLYSSKDISHYIKTPLDYTEIENLSREDILIEKVLLGFRSIVGVDLSLFNESQKDKLKDLFQEDKLIQKGNKVYSTNFMLADELTLYLDF
jgi:oxygen-independent coproporphyrinogen-3 oxidase